MRITVCVGFAIALSTILLGHAEQAASRVGQGMRVILLGTQGGPTFNAQRLGIGTLVVAGQELLLFDAGRSITTGMARAALNPADVTGVHHASAFRSRDLAAGAPDLTLGLAGAEGSTAGMGA